MMTIRGVANIYKTQKVRPCSKTANPHPIFQVTKLRLTRVKSLIQG